MHQDNTLHRRKIVKKRNLSPILLAWLTSLRGARPARRAGQPAVFLTELNAAHTERTRPVSSTATCCGHPITLIIRQGTTQLIGQLKEIPGVLTQGQTVAEVKENIQDALALYLADMREEESEKTIVTATISLPRSQ